ncbi:MAG: ribonuclease P protein component [Oscillospiraceae bacterium]|nr:ribonuclease P protein component [Oscillospiraceae bacterium]
MVGRFWPEEGLRAERDYLTEEMELCVSRAETLRENKQFRRVYYKGRVLVSSVVVTYVLRNGLKRNRFGITTSKKVGKAVVRNRAKRVIKAAFSEIKDGLPVGFDIVFVARKRTANEKSTRVKFVMLRDTRMLMER